MLKKSFQGKTTLHHSKMQGINQNESNYRRNSEMVSLEATNRNKIKIKKCILQEVSNKTT